ncbi:MULTISPECIES: sialidase family protein [Cysteiniphilum]|uniref:sialidase family protein n=1 Tax=Cysteiniphilum TaxID=2056696 RepID=UPI00177BBD8D|nr:MULTISPECIES: sialidase family protein [Cysteiniphilum]
MNKTRFKKTRLSLLTLFVGASLVACGGESGGQTEQKKGQLTVDTTSLKLNKYDGKGLLVIKNTGDGTLNNLSAVLDSKQNMHIQGDVPHTLAPKQEAIIEIDLDDAAAVGNMNHLRIHTDNKIIDIPVEVVSSDIHLSFLDPVADYVSAGQKASYTLKNTGTKLADQLSIQLTAIDGNMPNGISVSSDCQKKSLNQGDSCEFTLSATMEIKEAPVIVHILSNGEEILTKQINFGYPQINIQENIISATSMALLKQGDQFDSNPTEHVLYPGGELVYTVENVSNFPLYGLNIQLANAQGQGVTEVNDCSDILAALSKCSVTLKASLSSQPANTILLQAKSNNLKNDVVHKITGKTSADEIRVSPRNYFIQASFDKGASLTYTIYNASNSAMTKLKYIFEGNDQSIFTENKAKSSCETLSARGLGAKQDCTYVFDYTSKKAQKLQSNSYTIGFSDGGKVTTSKIMLTSYPDSFIDRKVLSNAPLPSGVVGLPRNVYQAQGKIYYTNGVGLSVSSDNGKSWVNFDKSTGLPANNNILKVFTDNSNVIYLLLAQNSQHALIKSTDNGQSWQYYGSKPPVEITAASLIDYDGKVISYTAKQDGKTVIVSSGDYGASWHLGKIEGNDNATEIKTITQLTHSYNGDGTLYMTVNTQQPVGYGNQVYSSTDKGVTWQLMNLHIPEVTNPRFVGLYVDGDQIDVTCLLSINPLAANLYRSNNGGKSFSKIDIPEHYLPIKVFQDKGVLYIVGHPSLNSGNQIYTLIYSSDNGVIWQKDQSLTLLAESTPSFSSGDLSDNLVLYASEVKEYDNDVPMPINIGNQDKWDQVLPQEEFSVAKSIIQRNGAAYVATQDKGIAYTQDHGMTWQFYNTSNTQMGSNKVEAFTVGGNSVSENVFAAVTSDNVVCQYPGKGFHAENSSGFWPYSGSESNQYWRYLINPLREAALSETGCVIEFILENNNTLYGFTSSSGNHLVNQINSSNLIKSAYTFFDPNFRNDGYTMYNNQYSISSQDHSTSVFIENGDDKVTISGQFKGVNATVTNCSYGEVTNVIAYKNRANLFVTSSAGLFQLDLSRIAAGDHGDCSQVRRKSVSTIGLPNEGKNLLDETIANGNIYIVASDHQVYKLAMDQLESGTWSQLTSPYPINYIAVSEDGNYLYALADNGSFLIHGVVVVNHF